MVQIQVDCTGIEANYQVFIEEMNRFLAEIGVSPLSAGSFVICNAGRKSNGKFVPQVEEDPYQRLGRVILYIDEHLSESLTLERLAEEAGLSKYHFSRVFRKEVGQTPWTYIVDARLQKAKSLLEEGVSPAAAASEAGFYDQSHLTNVLRKVERITPSAYQKRLRSDERESKDRNNFQEK